ncbi:acetyl-CoA carboxylase biotin carboxylase subunit [Streptomyces malaysiensis]|uniref:biotin carboxylase n=1 Tax=Streptomyces malaysiensis TaxID=92644 RepID=A0A7X5X9U4_STRMQ|nr:acetyl/propionyl/methylcrotonyl-CoA carboxylase subunit alpha [Streptomyces malaysiensis]NIY69283.1 acetyl/propionyl-CoA carboxylase subunit alpha [Streptomyces malaysiensis]
MFTSVLVANRGEIAVRIIRTLRAMGIRSVAVYSDADAGARHVREADEAVRIGPAEASASYLSVPRILRAAAVTGAQAVHPGYGFLSENTAFAAACAEAGLVFIGPPAAAIDAMGDKIRAKTTVMAAGVPVVPGHHEPGMSDARLTAAAEDIGYPVLLKPSAGGGGKGMRVVRGAPELPEAIAGARREAARSFGDDTMLIERFVTNPRHIEIQVLADTHGTTVHLGERECSLQRRHQKIIEEAPSPLLDQDTRRRMGEAAVEAARSVGYTGAGTVEFIVSADRPGEFFFLEMNTRLQVEHPVTELVTGLDLVEWQIRIASGQPLALAQEDITITGHAVEARVYAENPDQGFLPTGGTVLSCADPEGPGIRVDSGIGAGDTVGSTYDPMLAKIIAWAPDRTDALRRLDGALAETSLLGLTTNIGFLRDLLAHPDVLAGRLDTGLVERHLDTLTGGGDTAPHDILAAAALAHLLYLHPDGPPRDPWARPGGWRLGEPAWQTWRFTADGRPQPPVRTRGTAEACELAVSDDQPVPAHVRRSGPDGLTVTVDGHDRRYTCTRQGRATWLGRGGRAWDIRDHDPSTVGRSADGGGSDGLLRAPMPGVITLVKAVLGDAVTAGQPLIVMEAMKMEHTVVSPLDGVVTDLRAEPGRQVAMHDVLATVSATAAAPGEEASS